MALSLLTSTTSFHLTSNLQFKPTKSNNLYQKQLTFSKTKTKTEIKPSWVLFAKKGDVGPTVSERNVSQALLWATEAVYVIWLFLLPYAPGDPVWAISQSTISDLLGLSLNFFFILPLLNSAGIHLLEAPVLHPMAEGLFNFVIAWTILFAPLLYTDCKRNRYTGSLDILWGIQLFLTNTFLIPYMAIRLNKEDQNKSPPKLSQLGSFMVKNASLVGTIGGLTCLISLIWAFFARENSQFGGITDRIEYLVSYLGSERSAYAFIWDIVLYSIFQPWLIGDNIANVKRSNVEFVNVVRFVPVLGLVAYLLSLDCDLNES
ncbi:hypothetical protein LUZ60_017693 [Juncus effusus]|nr:hypothetical protein LUZ60_017693 [Juncus effusus]